MTTRPHVPSTDPGAMHYRAADTAAGLPGPACSPAYVPVGGVGVTDDPTLVTCSTCYAREVGALLTARTLTDTLTPVVALLPDDDGRWSVVQSPWSASGVRLQREDGPVIYVRVETYGKDAGRLRLTAGLPDGASYSDGDYPSGDTPAVTVTPTRPADVLARDLARRLLPAAVDHWTTARDRMSSRLARGESAESLTRELATIMRVGGHRGPWARDRRWLTYLTDGAGSSGTMESTDGRTVSVEIHGLTADHARELAHLLASWGGK